MPRRLALASIVCLLWAHVALAQRATSRSAGPQAPALRAAHDLSRGATLGAADIAADSSADPAAIEGWVTQRVVRRGEVLHEPAITRPSLVKAGTPVHLQATVDGVTVSRDGTAITAGSLGDQVRVRLDAQRTVTAVVAGPATVKLP